MYDMLNGTLTFYNLCISGSTGSESFINVVYRHLIWLHVNTQHTPGVRIQAEAVCREVLVAMNYRLLAKETGDRI